MSLKFPSKRSTDISVNYKLNTKSIDTSPVHVDMLICWQVKKGGFGFLQVLPNVAVTCVVEMRVRRLLLCYVFVGGQW